MKESNLLNGIVEQKTFGFTTVLTTRLGTMLDCGLDMKHHCLTGFELASTGASVDRYIIKFLSSLSRQFHRRVNCWIPANNMPE
jgi:hypothetical protein